MHLKVNTLVKPEKIKGCKKDYALFKYLLAKDSQNVIHMANTTRQLKV